MNLRIPDDAWILGGRCDQALIAIAELVEGGDVQATGHVFVYVACRRFRRWLQAQPDAPFGPGYLQVGSISHNLEYDHCNKLPFAS